MLFVRLYSVIMSVTCKDGRQCFVMYEHRLECKNYICGICQWGDPTCPFFMSHNEECPVAACSKPLPVPHQLGYVIGIAAFCLLGLIFTCFCTWIIRRLRNVNGETMTTEDLELRPLMSEREQLRVRERIDGLPSTITTTVNNLS